MIPGLGKYPGEGNGNPLVILPGESHGQKPLRDMGHRKHSSEILLSSNKEGRKEGSKVAQSCPALCNPTDSSPPGSSVHGIFQARVLEWVAIKEM